MFFGRLKAPKRRTKKKHSSTVSVASGVVYAAGSQCGVDGYIMRPICLSGAAAYACANCGLYHLLIPGDLPKMRAIIPHGAKMRGEK